MLAVTNPPSRASSSASTISLAPASTSPGSAQRRARTRNPWRAAAITAAAPHPVAVRLAQQMCGQTGGAVTLGGERLPVGAGAESARAVGVSDEGRVPRLAHEARHGSGRRVEVGPGAGPLGEAVAVRADGELPP